MRRTLKSLRTTILLTLSAQQRQSSIQSIAKSAGIDWYTTERQLLFLSGMELARQTLFHPQLRLYEITDKGKFIVMALNEKHPETLTFSSINLDQTDVKYIFKKMGIAK